MHSQIYRGEVTHSRLKPVRHTFRHPVYFYAFDLSEMARLARETVGFGYNRFAPAALHDKDYLDGAARPLLERAKRRLEEEGCEGPVERIDLITTARCFNYAFNPVSFYLCYGFGEELRYVIAEVNNTFGDRHLYVVPKLECTREGWQSARAHAKVFHVSPFNDMKGAYTFRVARNGGRLDIHVSMTRGGKPFFEARLTGRGEPLTTGSLWRTLLRYPLTVAMTMPRILTQAAVLYFKKRLPVHSRPEPSDRLTIIRRTPSRWERFCAARIKEVFRHIEHGCLKLKYPDGKEDVFGAPHAEPAVTIRVRRQQFFSRLVTAGDTGFGEAFAAGDFETDSLTGVLELLATNQQQLAGTGSVLNAWRRWRDYLAHLFRNNTRSNSRRNIFAHYDLGNDFYQTFLDPSMTYSSGMYVETGDTLEVAQQRKLSALIEKACIAPHHHVLEIGSGWGSFAIEAARQTGCRVTSITISDEQFRLASERVREAGLSERVRVQRCDYRDVQGSYDRIVSIEMLEAVGHKYLGAFFRQCDKLLKPNGLVVLQVITFPDYRYQAYRRSSDWIRKHIFPGGHLPALEAMSKAMTKHSRLYVEHLENIGPSYARTLRDWRRRFLEKEARLEALGLDEAFRRKWLYYLCYCEAGFSQHILKDLQLVLARSDERVPVRDRLRRVARKEPGPPAKTRREVGMMSLV